jgi:hypothetical protein
MDIVMELCSSPQQLQSRDTPAKRFLENRFSKIKAGPDTPGIFGWRRCLMLPIGFWCQLVRLQNSFSPCTNCMPRWNSPPLDGTADLGQPYFSLQTNHIKICLTGTALGTVPILRDVLPARTGGDTLIGDSQFLVIHETATLAFPFAKHYRFLLSEPHLIPIVHHAYDQPIQLGPHLDLAG